ncbi:MAG: thiamine-phosphate kinase [Geminicoccaceae bacterium]|nr:thiamine-phosphate kinase [Geminicoccaceae bacterium]
MSSGRPVGEFAFIGERLRPLAQASPAALDLRDDAAVLTPPPGQDLVLTKDAMVAGVHFLESDPPALIAQKLLRVNLSDLAAMGAEPLGHLLALARPPSVDDPWLHAFTEGLREDQQEFGSALFGGDTVSTPGPLTLCLTALGTVPHGQVIRRTGARPDDEVWVSGTLGDAALGLQVLQGRLELPTTASVFLIDRYRRPQPRLALGARLRGVASAMLDVSDGLLADLGHILSGSGVGATIEAGRLPLSTAGRSAPQPLDAALGGGDDYELLFTAPEAHRGALERIALDLALPLTRIGRTEAAPGLRTIDQHGRAIDVERSGWTHF